MSSTILFSGMRIANHMVSLVSAFPDFSAPGFDMDSYNNFFKVSNSIINATASDISYKEHWGCLSVKCAFGGAEIYQSGKRVYAVNESNFLILNEGQYYSSYIYAKHPVESFTLNFSARFAQQLFESIHETEKYLLDNPFDGTGDIPAFMEKLYNHDPAVSPFLYTIRKLAKNFNRNQQLVSELYYPLLEQLFFLHNDVQKEISNIAAVRDSTKQELYKRLHYAKDYINSCYQEDISLDDLAAVTFMNPAHLLRQFKKYFRCTPHQYLVQRRIAVAAAMLRQSDLQVMEICSAVGYEDASSFIKLFKKYYTVTPEAFRNKIF